MQPQHSAASSDAGLPKSTHFVISNVQNTGFAVRTVLTQHMHRDAEDILSNRGRGQGCHGTYNVAWYKCTCESPLSDDASSIAKTMFSENRYFPLIFFWSRGGFAGFVRCHFCFSHLRSFVVRLSETYCQQRFLFLGGFLAPWSLACSFGIEVGDSVADDQFLLVLTAPLLEWRTSHPTQAQASNAASRITEADTQQAASVIEPKRPRFLD
jgi:hypothetical protein